VRRALRAALVAATLLPVTGLGGCAVSLFSSAEEGPNDEMLSHLERRMTAIESAIDASEAAPN